MKDMVILLVHLLTTAAKLLGPGGARGFCQVNDIQTAQPIDDSTLLLLGHIFGARHLMPFTKCPRAKLAIVNRSCQVPTQPEQIAYHTVNRKKALRLPRRFEPTHLPFALTSWFM